MLSFFALRDEKAGVFLRPFSSQSSAMAIRQITIEATSSADHMFVRFPADFSLWDVGTFDESSGIFKVIDPVFLANLQTLIAAAPSSAPRKDS